MEDSLKAQTRMNRGSGNHLRRVSNSTNIPVYWKSFLRCDANKESLFHLLADAIREFHPPQRKQVISTYGQNVVSSAITDLSDPPCTHEEADARFMFHASHSFPRVFPKLTIHATYIDVVVLAIAVSSVLHDCETWVACGHHSKLRFIPCHLLATTQSNDGSWARIIRTRHVTRTCYAPPLSLSRNNVFFNNMDFRMESITKNNYSLLILALLKVG